MSIYTADISDEFSGKVKYLNLNLHNYGTIDNFHGEVVTLKVFEDNSLVRKELETDGTGKVLVVDGGASRQCALIGDNLAQLLIDNNWRGAVIYGCIRDSKQIDALPVGIMALGTCPIKSNKRHEGQRAIPLNIKNVEINHGSYIYADADGILIAESVLH